MRWTQKLAIKEARMMMMMLALKRAKLRLGMQGETKLNKEARTMRDHVARARLPHLLHRQCMAKFQLKLIMC